MARISKITFLAAQFAVILFAFGCAKDFKPTRSNEFKPYLDDSHGNYQVDPRDEIVIKSSNVKEIDGQRETVRFDGTITLNLLGELRVSGLKPETIERLMVEQLKRFYRDPRVRVPERAYPCLAGARSKGCTSRDCVHERFVHASPRGSVCTDPGVRSEQPIQVPAELDHALLGWRRPEPVATDAG